MISRRTSIQGLAGIALSSGVLSSGALSSGMTHSRLTKAVQRKFTMDLCPGRIGVRCTMQEAIELAAEHGFESVEPMIGTLRGQSVEERTALQDQMKSKGLVWGAAGLPVEFRQDEQRFANDLKNLKANAAILEQLGVTRVGTWLRPAHGELTYMANFRQHARRLRSIAQVLSDHGLSFGLEYVGPRTSWTRDRFAFIHTMAETKELIDAINVDNVGFVLDSWHWYTAEENETDLMSLTAKQVVAVDLNDAPKGLAVEMQIDNRRELPAQTGVIDVKTFLKALVSLGYTGPVRAEPFNQALNQMDNGPAVGATADAIRKAFAQLD